MHGFLVPTYTLHDFDDGEECKVVRMIFQMSRVPYEFKHVHRDDYILEGMCFFLICMVFICIFHQRLYEATTLVTTV